MKKLLQVSLLSVVLVALSSCTEEPRIVVDTEVEMAMNKKSFEVESFEFYDHTTLENYDRASAFDHTYFTVNDDKAFLTKVLLAPTQPEQPSMSVDRYDVEFAGGVLQGIWTDKYTYMRVVSLERDRGKITMELEGEHELHQQFQSIYLVLSELDAHPTGVAAISGLPE